MTAMANDTVAPAVPLASWLDRDGALLRLRLSRPKANIVDAAMIAALHGALVAHRDSHRLRGLLLDAEGPNFSFGASVEEHLPDACAQMLKSFHALVLGLLEFPVPVLVAIRGQALGGGLEVALAGSRIFVAPDAKLGQPEIRLGVFAPAASCLMPYRISQGDAEDLLISGRAIDAHEAKAMRLVDVVADDPEAAALAYFDAHLAPRSAAAVRCALTAARAPMLAGVRHRLASLERLYLDELMHTRDANEGLVAFLARRQPQWEHR